MADARFQIVQRTVLLKFRSGRRLRFANSAWHFPHVVLDEAGLQTLAERSEAALLSRDYETALAAIRAGRAARFADLTLDRDGISWKRGRLAWEDLGGVECGVRPAWPVGSFRWRLVERTGRQIHFTLQRFPNLKLALALIEQLRLESDETR